jgi:hypothetical protein
MTLLGGMGETMAVEGSTDREVFEAYVEHVLAPTLEAGQLVTMDNLLSPQTRQGEGADRGEGLRADLPTRLLAGLQPDRRSFLKDQGYAAPSRNSHEGRFDRRIGRSSFGGQCSGRPRLLPACWLSPTSPTIVKRAVESRGGAVGLSPDDTALPPPAELQPDQVGRDRERYPGRRIFIQHHDM